MSEIGSAEWWRVQYAALEKERDEAWAERAKMCAEKHSALADNAALLEAHQNIRDTWMGPFAGTADARMRATLRTGESVLEVAHPGAALLEEHRKALVRARDEGLEKAAAMLERYSRTGFTATLAGDVRAMKEPEE